MQLLSTSMFLGMKITIVYRVWDNQLARETKMRKRDTMWPSGTKRAMLAVEVWCVESLVKKISGEAISI